MFPCRIAASPSRPICPLPFHTCGRNSSYQACFTPSKVGVICSPSGCSPLAAPSHASHFLALTVVQNFNRHLAQFGVDAASSTHRPPIVEINLHRSPHCDPARDGQPLTQDARPCSTLGSQQRLAEPKTNSEG